MTTPRELLTAGGCWSACLIATRRVDQCRCRCQGAYHGLLAAADMSGLLDARRAKLDQLDDQAVIRRAAS